MMHNRNDRIAEFCPYLFLLFPELMDEGNSYFWAKNNEALKF